MEGTVADNVSSHHDHSNLSSQFKYSFGDVITTIARIEPSTLIPLATLPGSLNRLDPERPLVLYCHHGNRSLHAAEFLRQMGFLRLKSLRGGVESWSREIDPSVRRY